MQKYSASQAVRELTPGDKGIIQATLDDCRRLGDDDAVDELEAVILGEDIAAGGLAHEMAYEIVHDLKRRV